MSAADDPSGLDVSASGDWLSADARNRACDNSAAAPTCRTEETASSMSAYGPREWLPHERPLFPGSPSTPSHPLALRWVFALLGTLVAITGSLGNAMVTTNQLQLQGA